MTITKRVQGELLDAVAPADSKLLQKLRKSASALRAAHRARTAAEKNKGKAWTKEEHQRFLVAIDVFPSGPWKAIADCVGTKDSRQTMTHAQKYRQKHERQLRGLRNKGKKKRRAADKPKEEEEQLQMTDVTMGDAKSADAAHAPMDTTFSVAVTGMEISAAADLDFSAPPPAVTLVKQLSDSPRSAEDSVATVNDPFAPTDSLFALSLDASAAWLGAKPDAGDLMEILAGFEPETDVAWPQMWSTNSLDEIVASNSQFDFFGEMGLFP